MLLTALFAVALVRQTPAPPPIATMTLAGREVQVRLPEHGGEVPDSEPYIPLDGWNYFLNHLGAPNLKARDHGGWSSVATLYGEAKAKWTDKTPTWRVKVILFTRSDILDKTSDGLLRQRRSILNRREVDNTLQEVGRFVVAADAACLGETKVTADVEIDEDPLMGNTQDASRDVFNEAFFRRTAVSRTNAGGFVADDKQYRGPFQSVVILHTGLRAGVVHSQAYGSDVDAFSIFDKPWLAMPNVSETMLRLWVDSIGRKTTSDSGLKFRIESDVTGSVSNALNFTPWLAPALTDGATGATAAAKSWDDMKANPYRLRQWPTGTHPEDPVASLYVPPAFGPLYAALGSDLTPIAVYTSPEPRIVMDPHRPIGLTVYEGLGLAAKTQQAEAIGTPAPINRELLAPTSNYAVELTKDADRGQVVTLTEVGDYRSGHSPLPAGENPKGSVLRFDVKSTSKEPIALTVFGKSGPFEIVLGPTELNPTDANYRINSTSYAFKNDGTWQTIQIDLKDQAEPGSLLVVGPPVASVWYEKHQFEPVAYSFAKVTWTSALEGVAAPVEVTSPDTVAKAKPALTADAKTLLPMLSDRSDIINLNAATRFRKIKSVEAEPALIKLANGSNPRAAEEALNALAFQDTATARAAVRSVLDNSLFDHNRVVAAELLAKDKDPKSAGPISRIFAARSWQARLRAVELVAGFTGDDAKMITLVFLNQNEPEIRLTTTNLADPKNDLACRRLLWGSVNDPSDAVRLASYLQLLKAPVAKYRTEARKGVTDDSSFVRLGVLKAISGSITEEDRAALQQAVTDKSPSVRAEALRGFAGLPGAVKLEEVENTVKDEHVEVQLALIGLAVKKSLALPAEIVQKLKASANSEVANAAKALSGS